eukprot:s87_g24.t2
MLGLKDWFRAFDDCVGRAAAEGDLPGPRVLVPAEGGLRFEVASMGEPRLVAHQAPWHSPGREKVRNHGKLIARLCWDEVESQPNLGAEPRSETRPDIHWSGNRELGVLLVEPRSSKQGLFRHTPLPFNLPLEPISLEGREIWGEDSWDWSWQEEGYETQNGTWDANGEDWETEEREDWRLQTKNWPRTTAARMLPEPALERLLEKNATPIFVLRNCADVGDRLPLLLLARSAGDGITAGGVWRSEWARNTDRGREAFQARAGLFRLPPELSRALCPWRPWRGRCSLADALPPRSAARIEAGCSRLQRLNWMLAPGPNEEGACSDGANVQHHAPQVSHEPVLPRWTYHIRLDSGGDKLMKAKNLERIPGASAAPATSGKAPAPASAAPTATKTTAAPAAAAPAPAQTRPRPAPAPAPVPVRPPPKLRDLLQAAKPNWTEKDLNNVVEKLSKAQVSNFEQLRDALRSTGAASLNERYKESAAEAKTCFANMGFAAACLELVRPNGGAASPRVGTPLLHSGAGEGRTDVGTADLEAPAETSNLSEIGTESSDLDDPIALADLLLDPQINVRLVRGAFLMKLHQEQRPAVRRQEIEQEADAVVTADELIRWKTDADFRQKEWSWYFYDYMSIYQFYRGSAESYQQQCFDRAMGRMHYFYAHEYTHTYFITKLSPARALDTTHKIEVFYAPDGDGEAGQMQEVPIKDLKRNDTPYFERGWCEAEMQWSCMRGKASQTVALDFYEHSHALSLYCRAPMPPDVFQGQVERNELRFTHADNSKDVMELQRRVFLAKAASLETLGRMDLSASQIVILGLALPFYSRLQVLVVVGSQIEADGAEELAKALNMKKLTLKDCSISRAAMSALAGGLQRRQKLTRLQCTSCALRSEHIEALSRGLTPQSQIKILDLSQNEIDCDGATALARALLEGSKLRRLSLRGNKIADRGAGAFADVLRRAAMESQPLSDLDLDGNKIKAPGWKLLDQALEEVAFLAEAWFDKLKLGTHEKPAIFQTSLVCQQILCVLYVALWAFYLAMQCLAAAVVAEICGSGTEEVKVKVWDGIPCEKVNWVFYYLFKAGFAGISMFLALALAVWCLAVLAKRAGCLGMGSKKFELSVWRGYNLVISLLGLVSHCLYSMSWYGWCDGLRFLNQDIWIGALVLLEMLVFRLRSAGQKIFATDTVAALRQRVDLEEPPKPQIEKNPQNLPVQRWEVVHDLAMVREKPSLAARALARKDRGEIVQSAEETFDGFLKLHGEEGWCAKDCQGKLGLGALLRRLPGQQEMVLAADFPAPGSGPQHFKVIFSPSVAVRAAPSTDANIISARRVGEVVLAESQTYSGWIRLQGDGGWMLSRHPQHGVLLQPAFDKAKPQEGPDEGFASMDQVVQDTLERHRASQAAPSDLHRPSSQPERPAVDAEQQKAEQRRAAEAQRARELEEKRRQEDRRRKQAEVSPKPAEEEQRRRQEEIRRVQEEQERRRQREEEAKRAKEAEEGKRSFDS